MERQARHCTGTMALSRCTPEQRTGLASHAATGTGLFDEETVVLALLHEYQQGRLDDVRLLRLVQAFEAMGEARKGVEFLAAGVSKNAAPDPARAAGLAGRAPGHARRGHRQPAQAGPETWPVHRRGQPPGDAPHRPGRHGGGLSNPATPPNAGHPTGPGLPGPDGRTRMAPAGRQQTPSVFIRRSTPRARWNPTRPNA